MTTDVLDRVVRWNLDLDGDLYGDERERLRWYEGITAASSLQTLLIPWAAAIMVWSLGKPSVVPLAVVMALYWVPLMLSQLYVLRRKVDTTPRGWGAKRVVLLVLTTVPYLGFVVGAMYAWDPDGETWIGAIVGGVVGAVCTVVITNVKIRRRNRLEALAGDED
ncbi:hypothetical protein BJ973_008657 [Actinoplanes tereljensis]|uniref:DUF2029 domain-containing protein n=1 Tax=Paractinoplanes tereljensis TaxID=571912 RepID=A0A919TRT7_9ACTN|nr:hypothetical protein [Actinoplanes tereljensis]GIF18382.1 hypothetical protein Ate02nite_11120 [Actinoplanes tereljensis]